MYYPVDMTTSLSQCFMWIIESSDKDNSQVSHHSGEIMAEPVRAKPLFSQNGVIYEAIIRFNAHLTPSIQ